MFDRNVFSNLPAKNILKDDYQKNLSENVTNSYVETSLDNLVLNSNLDNENVIK